MFSKDEKDYLNKIPSDKKVRIFPFDKNTSKIAKEIIFSIKEIYSDLEVIHMGASALKISGQKDIDIYAFSDPKDFHKYILGLVKLFGKSKNKHKSFYEWKFKKKGFDIEFYLTDKHSKTMKKQINVYEILKKDKGLLKKYEKLKESFDGKSFKKYQEEKYRFYSEILNR